MKTLPVLVVFAIASISRAQTAATTTQLSLERNGDGKPACGLGKGFHGGRRQALREALKEGVVVVRGLPDTRDYLQFRQDKVFWYLTGVESPDAALAMDCASGREVLFLPPQSRSESWNGEMWDASDAWVKELSGFTEVRPSKDLVAVIGEMRGEKGKLWISMHPNVALAGCFDQAEQVDKDIHADPLDGRVSREQALADALQAKFGVKPEDLSSALNELRRVKTSEEIAAMRRAGHSGALAMAEAIRSTRPGLGEWEMEGLMSWIQIREGAAGPAYRAIVGSGPNSLILHYGADSRRMQDGDVLLIDYAPELDHYTCDITRTWPVNGKFSARQAELYDAVLAAQKAGIAAVKPGAKIGDVEKACADVLKQRGLAQFTRHAACHYIGMEVHDVGGGGKPLVPGVCFTVEPGLYEEATDIGVRIEDVVCVTADGCEVLSREVPKERDELEKLIQSEGVLDWMRAR